MRYHFEICYGDDIYPSTYIESTNLDEIKMFVLQHNFKYESLDSITIKNDEYNYDTTKQLELFKFRSNLSDEEISIYTTYDLLNNVIELISDDMNDISVFRSNTIVKIDLPIIKVVNDLIHSLPYSTVFNYVNDILDEGLSIEDLAQIDKYNKYIKVLDTFNEYDYSGEPLNHEFLSLNMIDYRKDALSIKTKESHDNDMFLPITIEAYISCIIKIFKGMDHHE